jgi:hypothetical protein
VSDVTLAEGYSFSSTHKDDGIPEAMWSEAFSRTYRSLFAEGLLAPRSAILGPPSPRSSVDRAVVS